MINTRLFKSLAIMLSLCAHSTLIWAQSAKIEEIDGKRFVVLQSEEPPETMFWGKFGDEIENYFGVSAKSNGDAIKNRSYQCTELIHRFLRDVYGLPSRIGMGLGHGKDLASGVGARFGNSTKANGLIKDYIIHLEYFENGFSLYPPVVGSIVSMHFSSTKKGYGHVGIIRTLSKQSDGTLRGFLFDQHGSIHKEVGIPIKPDTVVFNMDRNGVWRGNVESWKFQRSYPVIGWTNIVSE